MSLVSLIRRDQSGASAAEYAILVAFIGGVIVVGAMAVGSNVSTVFTEFAPKVATP